MERPPSVDTLARSLAGTGLPHALLVEVAREAIAGGRVEGRRDAAQALRRTLLTPVVNATGVLLHTNLGRAPLAHSQPAMAVSLEIDLATGERGSRQTGVGGLLARLCGAEAATVVNNNAAAVLLVLAALAAGRAVPVSRGESVEIGGGFRVPEVMEQSGARLVDVGTTNRTRLADYRRALDRHADVALVLKVHPSNYRVDGFVEATSVEELATLGVPVVADLGSGLRRRDLPVAAGAAPARLAGRRAGGPPDARRRRRPRDVQRRQAARRPAGRDHRRAGRPGRPLRRPPAGQGPPTRRAGAGRAAGRRPRLPPARRRGAHPVLADGDDARRGPRRAGPAPSPRASPPRRSRPRPCPAPGRLRARRSRRGASPSTATTSPRCGPTTRRCSPGRATGARCSTCAPSTRRTTRSWPPPSVLSFRSRPDRAVAKRQKRVRSAASGGRGRRA